MPHILEVDRQPPGPHQEIAGQPVAGAARIWSNAAKDDAVEQVPAQAATHDHAQRRPGHQVADIVLSGGGRTVEGRRGPQALAAQLHK